MMKHQVLPLPVLLAALVCCTPAPARELKAGAAAEVLSAEIVKAAYLGG